MRNIELFCVLSSAYICAMLFPSVVPVFFMASIVEPQWKPGEPHYVNEIHQYFLGSAQKQINHSCQSFALNGNHEAYLSLIHC